jgi:RNA polymerase sigma factor (sigma-70 family)
MRQNRKVHHMTIPAIPPLSRGEAGERARRAGDGDRGARWELVASVLPMLRDQAKLFALRRGKSRLIDDLIAEAVAGLWAKAHQYDPGRGNFSTFAWCAASNAFADVVGELAHPARLPMYLVESVNEREQASEAVIRAASAAARAYEPIGVRPANLLDPPASAEDPAAAIDRADTLRRLCRFRELLTPRERRVLAMRFRLDRTHKEIGRWLGVSYETVRQSEIKAIGKLRKAMGVITA